MQFKREISSGDVIAILSVIFVGWIGISTLESSERQKRSEFTMNILQHYDGQLEKMFFDVVHNNIEYDGNEPVFEVAKGLNRYEFMCVALLKGFLDTELFLSDAAYSMQFAYRRFEKYIKRRRDVTKEPALYEALEKVATKVIPEWRIAQAQERGKIGQEGAIAVTQK